MMVWNEGSGNYWDNNHKDWPISTTKPNNYLSRVCQEVQTDNNGKADNNLGWGVSTSLYLQHSRMPLLRDRRCGLEGPPLQSLTQENLNLKLISY